MIRLQKNDCIHGIDRKAFSLPRLSPVDPRFHLLEAMFLPGFSLQCFYSDDSSCGRLGGGSRAELYANELHYLGEFTLNAVH